tara:strand:- start:7499 stop:8227 length:729 start_codon:yes stop_codon:yes gene_type:complete
MRGKRAQEEVAYCGYSRDLQVCLNGGHFTWDENVAEDYAVPEVCTQLGYVIEVSPLHLHLTGATMKHGGQWWNLYDKFEIEDTDKPQHWHDMVELVQSWVDEKDNLRSMSEPPRDERTVASYLQTRRWMQPEPAMKALLDVAAHQPPPAWDSGGPLLAQWKAMVHAAVRAAPWDRTGPSTNEFVAEGGHVQACINKVTEYVNDDQCNRTHEVVYERDASTPLGSERAAAAFDDWYSLGISEQ